MNTSVKESFKGNQYTKSGDVHFEYHQIENQKSTAERIGKQNGVSKSTKFGRFWNAELPFK